MGPQPGVAPQSALPAHGEYGRRRGNGQYQPGRLIGYRELRGVRPHSCARRQSVHDQPQAWGDSAYTRVVGALWKKQPSVYGPVATAIQRFAASIGGTNVATTVWILMILNGAVFLGVGLLLLKTSDDPVRATLFWTANPVLIQQLVGGGHLDTFVAAGPSARSSWHVASRAGAGTYWSAY